MFNYYFKLFLTAGLFLFIVACSSTKRFTDEEKNDKNYTENNLIASEIGVASFYANEYDGKKTSSGEVYNMNDLTAAHPSYPFDTIVLVTNLANNKSVQVRINDRMPSFKGRIIDLSLAAAKKIGIVNSGVQKVKTEVIKWGSK